MTSDDCAKSKARLWPAREEGKAALPDGGRRIKGRGGKLGVGERNRVVGEKYRQIDGKI